MSVAAPPTSQSWGENERPARLTRRQAGHLLEIAQAAERVRQIVEGHTRQALLGDGLLRDAMMYHLTRIGETVGRLDPEVCRRYPDINWRAVGRFRVADTVPSSGIDWGMAWDVATKAVPALARLAPDAASVDEPAANDGHPVGSPRIAIPIENLAAFCKRWKIVELALFGSALRDDFRPDSDVDVLVTFAPDARVGLFDCGRMEEELAAIFGRPVDLVERRGVEQSANWIRRQAVLSNARPVYVAG